MKAIRMFLLAMGLVAAFAIGGGGEAHASSVGVCSVDGTQPLPVAIDAYGRKTSGGQAAVSCSATRYVQVEVQLVADDALSDDVLVDQFWTGTTRSTTVYNGRVSCNEDVGTDELYSRARLRYVSGDVWTSWTSWDRGATYSYSC
jgi:hypothetical protein